MSEDVVIERAASGKPHKGKVLAVVVPHSDDCPIFAGGTVAKLIEEGYSGYLIRLTNDDHDSCELPSGETMAMTEKEAREMAGVLGITKVYDLNYRNHYLDQVPPTEIRARLVYLYRLLRVDTILTFDPDGLFETNPEHTYTGKLAEYCCYLSGNYLDLPEHYDAGLEPHGVSEKYYWARNSPKINRVVDISGTIDKKLRAVCENKTQVLNMVKRLRTNLAKQGKTLPFLERDDAEAARGFADICYGQLARNVGKAFDLEYAAGFRHVGPYYWPEFLGDYVESHAVNKIDSNR